MEFNHEHKHRIAALVVILFYILLTDRWLNGMMLYQMEPAFFLTRMDVFTWGFMYTGLHKSLLNNPVACAAFDVLFCILPLINLLLLTYNKWAKVVAWLWLAVNWVYVQCYTLYPANSIEGHLAWMFMPFLFTCTTLRSFYLTMQFLRFFFLWFMTSAGLWKIWQGGIFNYEEMSAILYVQHKEFLITSPGSWLAGLYYWLIRHTLAGYLLYAGSACIELFFAVGFFTRRLDYWLITLSFVFFTMDVLVMRIKYWEITPFLLCLYYSRTRFPSLSLK